MWVIGHCRRASPALGNNHVKSNGRRGHAPSRILGALFLAAGLGACSGGGSEAIQGAIVEGGAQTATAATRPASSTVGNFSETAAAVVIADEPRAVIIARDTLEDGGTVADAATALYFTLAATLPGAAGLGGGGVCLYHDNEEGKVESIDFLARTPAVSGPIAVPGNVRGFALLHARHGRLSWNEVVAPGERIAISGFPVSRALARRLQAGNGLEASSPFVTGTFRGPGGAFLGEGDFLVQQDLAITLGRIRGRGAGEFYTGPLARTVVAAASQAGGTLTIEDMRAYRPTVGEPARLEYNNRTALVPGVHTGAGALQQDVLSRIADAGGSNAEIERTVFNVLAERGAAPALPSDFGSTSFLIAGRNGDAVACGLTMNGAFGAGVGGRELGFAFARAPQRSAFGLGGAFLTPVMVRNEHNGTVYFIGSGAGGPSGVAGALHAALATGFAPDINLAGALGTTRSDLVNPVHAIACPDGLERNAEACQYAVDPRGSGLAAESLEVR